MIRRPWPCLPIRSCPGRSSLPQDPVLVQQAPRFDDALLHPHELLADDVALPLRIGDARPERRQKLLRPRAPPQARAVRRDEFGFALAHQTRYPRKLRARARRPARAWPARRPRSNPPRRSRRRRRCALPTHSRISCSISGTRWRGSQSCTAAADAEHEVGQILPAARGMHHFGVKLHAVEPAFGRGDGGHAARRGAAGHRESPRAARPPGRDGSSRSAGSPASPSNSGSEVGSRSSVARPYSPFSPLRTSPPSRMSHELLAVADAQHGRAQGKNSRVYRGAARIVNADGPPEMMMPLAAPSSAAGVSLARTSAYTPRSRTLRAIR